MEQHASSPRRHCSENQPNQRRLLWTEVTTKPLKTRSSLPSRHARATTKESSAQKLQVQVVGVNSSEVRSSARKNLFLLGVPTQLPSSRRFFGNLDLFHVTHALNHTVASCATPASRYGSQCRSSTLARADRGVPAFEIAQLVSSQRKALQIFSSFAIPRRTPAYWRTSSTWSNPYLCGEADAAGRGRKSAKSEQVKQET